MTFLLVYRFYEDIGSKFREAQAVAGVLKGGARRSSVLRAEV